MIEQLQRLAEAIADTYVRDLKRETGGNTVEHNGVSGTVESHLLASGLVDNAMAAASGLNNAADPIAEAYKLLMDLISLDGREYQLTEHGRNVINTANRIALTKNRKPTLN